MYKILIHIDTQSGDKWFYYQENGKDYVTDSLQEIKDTVLTLIDVYGEDYIKIVKQTSGQDMDNADEYLYNSTKSYEELSNRPFINGVEIVGQLSLEDLGIQPAGDYLDQTDLEEIENKINSIDVSAYATNERVDQVEDKIDNIDLGEFYTKEETDAKDNERLRGYFWDYKGNCITTGSSLERINQSRYGTTFQELSALWDQIAVGGMHPIEVKDKNNYRAWLMPSGTAGGSTYIVYKYRGQVIDNTPSSAASASLYRSYYLEFRVNRDDNKLWEADFLCKEGYEQPSMARVENYVQEQMVNLIGDLTTLATEDKSNLVNAINEVITNMGEVEVDIDIPVYSLTSAANFQNSSFNFNDILTELSNIVTNNLEKPIMVIVRSNNSTSLNYKKFCVLLLCYASPTSVLSNITETIRGFTIDNGTGDISIVTFSTRRNNTVGAITFTSFGSNSTYASYLHSQNALSKYNTTAFTPTGDYHPATKKYIDDAITNIDIPEDKPIYTITISNAHLLDNPSGITTLNEETIAELDVIVKDAAKKGYAFFMVYAYYKNQNHQMLFSSGEGDDLLDKPAYINIYGETVRGRYTASGQLHRKYSCQLRINMTWDNDVPTVTAGYLYSGYYIPLSANNTIEFTPTSDYNPATKKYVDDIMANVGSNDDSILPLEPIYNLYLPKTVVMSKLNTEDAETVRDFLNYCKDNGIKRPFITLDYCLTGTLRTYSQCVLRATKDIGGSSSNTFKGGYFSADNKYVYVEWIVSAGIDADGNYGTPSTSIYTTTTKELLPKDNTVEFTPDGDYEPATKKYVDDAIVNASGGNDLTNYYTKAEVDALLQALRDEFVSANNSINDKLETIIYGGE